MVNLIFVIFLLICGVTIVVGTVYLVKTYKKEKNKGYYDVVNEEMNEEDK